MISDIFCKIINGEISADIVWQDDDFLVIKDIHPEAPIHLLVIVKKHFTDMDDFDDSHASLLGKGLLIIEKITKQVGLEKGYRIIINRGSDSERGVPHFHMHVLGGRKLGAKIAQ